MARGGGRLAVCLGCCAMGLAVLPVAVLGAGSSSDGSPSGEGAGASSSLGGPLVTPGSPTQGEQVGAAEEAKLANPNAVAEREASRTKFESLNAEGAEKTDGEAFPGVIDNPAGGPPKLSAGESITGYPADNAAQVDLPEGKHGVLESLQPIAVQTGPGQRVPVDLGLRDAGSAFEPTTPVVGVSIPKQLSSGISLSGVGVSFTPVDAQGAALGGSEGSVDGASVFYANTLTDMDTVVKPMTLGFETDTVLRSVESPQQLLFRVGMPEGASLVQVGDGSGVVEVVKEGATLATIAAPVAQDAAGTAVPVSMSASGDILELAVDHGAGEYQYPIEVDPYVKGDEQVTGASKPTNWKFCVNYSTTCAHEEGPFKSTGWGGEGLVDQARSKYAANETAAFVYQTQGESRIFELGEGTSGENAGSNIESVIQIVGEKEKEGKREEEIEGSYILSVNTNYGEKGVGGPYVCAKVCSSSSGSADNIARFQQTATGSGEHFSDTLWTADVYIAQEHGPEQPTFNYSSEKIDSGRQNVLYGSGSWLSPTQGAFEVHDKDPGIGISYFHADIAGSWGLTREYFEEGKCSGVQCFPEVNELVTYNSKMADGEDDVEAFTQDLAQNGGSSLVGQATIKVDGTPPRGIVLNGLPSSGVIDEAQYHLQAQATDGSGKTPSTGIKSIALYLDGYEVAGKSGSCAPGPCTSVGEWTINGEAFGAGKHTLTVQTTDNAGNVENKPYSITVRHAGSLGAGPGSVDPITGSFHLSAGDVSIGSGQGSLGVSRSYNSRQLKAGEDGPLGPQWSLNISGSHALEREPSGSVLLIAPDGSLATFESNGKGGFVSAKGDENLVLSDEKEGELIKAYLLKDPALGTTVRYTQPGGVGPWVIASSEGALSKGSGEKETFEWERLEGLTRPKMALAPVPAGVTCSKTVKEPKELSIGCRALTFVYAAATTATGEAPSEWKAYKGRLEKVLFTAYNPSTKAMEEKPVAEYAYDKQGRLRAEWDPRISTALKTTYGYDAEGHVVSVNPPGLQPWLLHYGTTAGDPSAGRLLSVTRPAASTATELKEADGKPAPVNTVLPTLSSTSPAIGTTLSISSNGSWNNSPLAYGDSWEDCYTQESKETCTPIPGAVNSTYTPQARDAGYTLKAQVTAVNSDGVTVATTTASKAVAVAAPGFLRSFGSVGEGEKQFKGPAGEAVDAGGNVWVIDHGNNRVEEWSATGGYMKAYGTKGSGNLQFKEPQGIAINQGTGNVYVADTGNNRIEELNSKGEYVTAFGKKGSGSGELSLPSGVAVAPNGDVWVGDTGNDRVAEFSETGEALGSFGKEGTGNGQFEGPDGIAFSGGNAYVADVNNNRVQEFSLSGEYVRQFGAKGSSEGQFSTPYGIATEPVSGDLWVSDYGNNRIEEFSSAGVFLMAFGKKGAGNGEFTNPEQVAVNATGDVYVSDTANNRVQELEPKYSKNNPAPEPPTLGKSAVSTIDYNVPLWGEGAPGTTAKTEAEKKTELEKWGQTDDPTEATAVFPPDEPMGWPAKDYKRATISYYDELGRTVNRASPSGGISTSEYNEDNEVIRSLSADNRAAALKEAKPKEASELLDTKSSYNTEGTELLNTWGPQHTVKLSSGSEVKARNHVKYYYDEGAPEGETFDLVTKTTDGAEYEGKEADIRMSTSSYSGQEGLGWLLRKPTSVTTDPEGLKLTHTTAYDPVTGNVTETAPSTGWSRVASIDGGSESSALSAPEGAALDASGDVWVTEAGSYRIDEFSAAGTFIKAIGWGVSDGKSELEICTSTCKVGIKGSGVGQFGYPEGIAINQTTGNVYVADRSNNRVEEFEPTGAFVRQFGETGSHEYEEVKLPTGIAITPTGGEVWVSSQNNGTYAIQRFSETGAYKGAFGKPNGTGNGQFSEAYGIAFSGGDAYIVDRWNSRVQEFSMSGVYISQFGSRGSISEGSVPGKFNYPTWIVADPVTGDLYVNDANNDRVEEFSAKGAYVGQFGSLGLKGGETEFSRGLTVNRAGAIYVVNVGKIEIWEQRLTAPIYSTQFGNTGSESEKLSSPTAAALDSGGDVWVVDAGKNRVVKFSISNKFTAAYGTKGSGTSQFTSPAGIAINQSTGNVYVADSGNNRIEVLSAEGKFVSVFGWGVSNGESKAQICTTSCQAGIFGSGAGQFNAPVGVTVDASGNVWVVDSGNNRIEEFNAEGKWIASYGSTGSEPGKFKEPRYIAFNGDLWVTDAGNKRFEEFSTSGKYRGETKLSNSGYPYGIGADPLSGNLYVGAHGEGVVREYGPQLGAPLTETGSAGSGNGQLKEAGGVAVGSAGAIYVVDTGNSRVEEWTPATREASSEHAPGQATKTIYYTQAANTGHPACGEHAEWANLVCEIAPAEQPEVKGLPELPVITYTKYNMLDEPETVAEEFGATKEFGATIRTKTMTYDAAGRALTSEETTTGSTDTAVPKVTDEYSSETGVMIKQSTTVGETTKSIKSVYDTIGHLTKYTDADGNTTEYTYSGPVNDGQVEEVKYGGNKGSQMYSYNPTTKALDKLLDVGPEGGKGAGTFTASYDFEGKLTSETYPNGMTAKYMFNPAGEATGIEYEKAAHCAGACPEVWFKETVVPSIHGEALVRTSTLAKEEYKYDEAGRLTKVNETPMGKGCKTRVYVYNEDSDRTSETTLESETETCATEGGNTESHRYDEANRLRDFGVAYETFGNQTSIPADDAGEHEITASFYTDNQVAVQAQNGETTNYTYDPAARTEKTISEGTTKATVVNHYPGPGEAISWACEEAAKECEEGKGTKWTRDIPGIDGALSATQKNTEAAVLQLHDLEGNIVATAAVSETETKLLTTYNPTEFGVQVNGTPPTKFSWLGAGGLATEASSGAANPGGGSYVPQLGRPLQTEPVVPPGAFPNGAYSGAPYTTTLEPWVNQSIGNWGAGGTGREAARQAEAKKQQEEQEARARADRPPEAIPTPSEGGVEEGGWEGTVGDPVGCNVRAFEPQQEDTVTHHPLEGWGSFVCSHALDSITMEVCLQEERTAGHWHIMTSSCDATTFANFSFGEFGSKRINCSVGKQYRTAVWIHVGKENGEKKRSSSIECEENLGEEGIGLL